MTYTDNTEYHFKGEYIPYHRVNTVRLCIQKVSFVWKRNAVTYSRSVGFTFEQIPEKTSPEVPADR